MLNRLQDVFKSFQRHEVKYMVIGGVASVLYGIPRVTFDLDILIDATCDNAQRLLNALVEAGFGTATMTNAQEVIAHEITVFNDRVRIDVQTKTDLIASKRASARQVDIEDVRLLELPENEQPDK
jgi:hypothetical protein